MRKIFIALALFLACGLCVSSMCVADEQPSAHDLSEESLRAGFPNLKIEKFGQAWVAYDPGVTTLINKRRAELPRSHVLYFDDGLEANDVVLLETVLSGSDRYNVVFSEGPSADPMFYFIKVGATSDLPWATIAGNTVAIPHNGALYAASRFNNHFTKRQKFAYQPGGLQEVRQPYFLVGLRTRTLEAITLYASPNEKSVVAQLPAGTEIGVVLTDDREDSDSRTCFLIRTPFGLLGWAWVPSSQYKSGLIEGISWWGD
jgi:hypothetical protein